MAEKSVFIPTLGDCRRRIDGDPLIRGLGEGLDRGKVKPATPLNVVLNEVFPSGSSQVPSLGDLRTRIVLVGNMVSGSDELDSARIVLGQMITYAIAEVLGFVELADQLGEED